MTVVDYFQAIKRVNALASRRATGTPAELAQKLDIPPRSLYRLIEVMKELDIPIAYNRHCRSYVLHGTSGHPIA
jgi:DNA-binding IclR family transcriptional regulator